MWLVIRSGSSFILWNVCVQFSSTICLKYCSFPHLILLALLSNQLTILCEGLYMGSVFCSIELCLSLCYYHTVLVIVALCSRFWAKKAWLFQPSFSFSRLFWLFRILWNSIWVLGFLFVCLFCKKMPLGFW